MIKYVVESRKVDDEERCKGEVEPRRLITAVDTLEEKF